LEATSDLLGCRNKSLVKNQLFCAVPEVKESMLNLAWAFGHYNANGRAVRMTQFKEKSKQHKDYINAGCFNYPF